LKKLAIVLILALALTGCGNAKQVATKSYVAGNGTVTFIESKDRKTAPVLTGLTLDGENLQVPHGGIVVVNVWASWCVACREEHPVLVELAKSNQAPVIGLDYKDKREDALAMLQRQGDPYVLSAFDGNGRVGIDYGVYGVPETYIIDQAGIIRFKHIGPITMQVLNEKMYPLIRELKKS